MQLMSTSTASTHAGRYGRRRVLVRCSAQERPVLRALIDEYHPEIDVYSVREHSPRFVELCIQYPVERRHDADLLLRQRLQLLGR